MLIHGRLILTANGFMLDELKSLLQKSLRRKDYDLVTRATKELTGYGKDQLPWKSLITFLFEDHGLSDLGVLKEMVRFFNTGNKLRAVELLFECYTCRIGTCFPVVTLEEEYDPIDWKDDLEIKPEYQGLVAKISSQINVELLIANLIDAWQNGHHKNLMTYFKMLTMVQDVMNPDVTRKGEAFLIKAVKKPKAAHVFMSVLYKVTSDSYMKQYIYKCFELATIRDVCLRLILVGVLTQFMYRDQIKPIDDIATKTGVVNWKTIPKLDRMPAYAVDKHTFRGKFGKGTKHLMKNKRPSDMSDDAFEEFHGERPKAGLEHFFDVGCICEKKMVEENPFWEKTKEIYYGKPHKLQKTVRMTAVYFKELLKKYPAVKWAPKKKEQKKVHFESGNDESEVSEEEDTSQEKKGKLLGKRRMTRNLVGDVKELWGTPAGKGKGKGKGKGAVAKDEPIAKKKKVSTDTESKESQAEGTSKQSKKADAKSGPGKPFAELGLKGPLLQLPTGSAKLYTCLDVSAQKVYKGPYPPHKLSMTLFFHRAMREVFEDPHTMPVETEDHYVIYELCKDPECDIQITKRDFYNAISKSNMKDGEFVTRESLGVIQLHRLPIAQIHNVPMSFWAHYIYRFALNIGDSGLYNSITDKNMTFLYGIDMEERRKNVNGNHILDLMFVKRPAKAYCEAIMNALTAYKDALLEILVKPVNYARLDRLAAEDGFDDEGGFDRGLFMKRIISARQAVARL